MLQVLLLWLLPRFCMHGRRQVSTPHTCVLPDQAPEQGPIVLLQLPEGNVAIYVRAQLPQLRDAGGWGCM